MRRLALLGLVALAPAGLSACGGAADAGESTGGGATAAPAPNVGAVAVIRGWAHALRRGDVAGAARYFARPALVSNGSPPLPVRTTAEAEAFNRALPCGAELLRAVEHGGYVFGSFRLTDRAGAGAEHPCPGRGAKAAVAFRIAGGRIREWRRVSGLPPGAPPRPAPTGPTRAA